MTNSLPHTRGFNTQPPEGGWTSTFIGYLLNLTVSTHSRLKAAGCELKDIDFDALRVSTHSRLKAAGSDFGFNDWVECVSTHSRLKAAGQFAWLLSIS